jgi:hypothetical protein
MLASAMNFVIGLFGYLFEGQYQQSITIEADGCVASLFCLASHLLLNFIYPHQLISQFNNTLTPYKTCLNTNDSLKADRGRAKVAQWAGVYLTGAVGRLRLLIEGYELQVEDMYVVQQLCAYKVHCVSHRVFPVVCTPVFFTAFLLNVDWDSHANTPHTDCRAGILQVLRAVHRGGVGWVRLFP